MYFQQNIKAQSISEISTFLCDSIVGNTDRFVNKPFGDLVKELKYPIKYYIIDFSFDKSSYTVKFSSIVLYFETLSAITMKIFEKSPCPRITVHFTKEHTFSRKYFEDRGIMGGTEWNTEKTAFIGFFEIGSLFAYGD